MITKTKNLEKVYFFKKILSKKFTEQKGNNYY